MVDAGRIWVNGNVATLGQPVIATDQIAIDGRKIYFRELLEYDRVIAYHKPEGELVTRHDPEGRETVFRHLPKLKSGRWIAIGRLDINTSGLLLLTTDGELAERLMHPRHEIPREYAVRIFGEVDDEMIKRLQKGVQLEDGPASFNQVKRMNNQDEGRNLWFSCILQEGRNREVRRLWESQDVKVSRLIRTRYGPQQLGRDPKRGRYRELTPGEINSLREAVEMPAISKPDNHHSQSKRR